MGPKRQCQIRPVPNGRATCGHLCSRLKSRACVLKEYRRPSFGSKAEPTVPSVGCACAINHRHGKHPCGPNVHQPPASYTGIAHSPASDSEVTRPVLVQWTGVSHVRRAAALHLLLTTQPARGRSTAKTWSHDLHPPCCYLDHLTRPHRNKAGDAAMC